MKITIGYWETRDGRKARVLCTDAPGDYPIVGYIVSGGKADPWLWFPDGSGLNCGGRLDLERPWVDRPAINWAVERDWVKAVAGDEDGQWFRYSGTPVLGPVEEWSPNGNAFQWMHPSECPQFTGNWKDSLCVRPEVKA